MAVNVSRPTTRRDSNKPYADHCRCQSCSDVRQGLSAAPDPPPPMVPTQPFLAGDDDARRYLSPAGDLWREVDELDTADQVQDLLDETEEEEESEDGEELRLVPSNYSLLAFDPAVSRRPIVCPVKPCARHIAVHTLDWHFRFEHPEVPMVALSPDYPSATFSVAPLHCLSPLTTECAAILRVSWKDEEGKIHPDAWKLVLAYTAMPDGGFAAWVFGALEGDQEISARIEMSTWISGESRYIGDCRSLDAYNPYCKGGNDDLSSCLMRSISYLGPVVPLREPQEVNNILERGDCLYLTPGLMTLLTSAPQGAFIQVTITF